MQSSPGTTAKGLTIEEQRAALHRQLTARPNDSYIRQALMRLISPQHIKHAARHGVFISYSRSDELFAIELAEDLREAGLKVWLDMTDIPNDSDWDDAVTNALNDSGLMVLVISPSALHDEYLQQESRYFMEQGKIIVPVMYKHSNLGTLNMWNQPIDFRHDYKLGLTILIRLLTSQTGYLA